MAAKRGVRAASKSSIEISFMVDGKQCRERLPLEPTPANLKRAQQQKASIDLAIHRGEFEYAEAFPRSKRAVSAVGQSGQVPLGQYLDEWLERKAGILKASTLDGYRKIVAGVLVPALGSLALASVTRKEVRAAMAKMSATNKRLANVQSCLRSALSDAVDDELIESNPLAGWTYSVKGKPRTEDEIDPFSPDEQRAILAAATGQYRNLLQFAFWTGLRTSELVALEWGDIDWHRGEVRVSRGLTAAASEAETPKTAAGVRSVRLLPMSFEALKAQREHTYIEGKAVFHDPRHNRAFNGDQELRKSLWTPTIRRAGVRYRNPYQTRHTYASMMLSAGEHPMWVAKQMGHASWLMIARVYGRWIPTDGDSSGDKAAAMFGSPEKYPAQALAK
jgi:integrase